MSMETFQNVDEWLISTDVSSLLASSGKEAEPVPGLDDDDADDTSYLTPTCIADDFWCYDVTDCLNSPLQGQPSSECRLDINEVLPCDGKLSERLFAGHMNDELQANEFGVQYSSALEGDPEQLPEVSIGELESMLLIDSESENVHGGRQLADCITVDSGELGSVLRNTMPQSDFVHHVTKEEPAGMYEVDESSSSEEDETRDTTWSYHTRTTRRRHRRSHYRSHACRRLSAARSTMADERKKQQNKSAATRYREKKRSEEMENALLCAALERRNKELHTRIKDMTQEVAVLRQLVIDIFRSANVSSL